MANVLGIRCWASQYNFVCLSQSDGEIGVIDRNAFRCPTGDRPSQLHWFRNEVLEVLRNLKIEAVGVKVAEGIAGKDCGRSEMEGVAMEACAASNVRVRKLTKSSLRSLTGFQGQIRYVLQVLDDHPATKGLPGPYAEAAVAALSAFRI